MKLTGNVTATISGSNPITVRRVSYVEHRETLPDLHPWPVRWECKVEMPREQWLRVMRRAWHATVRNRPGRYWKRRRLPGRYRKP